MLHASPKLVERWVRALGNWAVPPYLALPCRDIGVGAADYGHVDFSLRKEDLASRPSLLSVSFCCCQRLMEDGRCT